MDTRDLKLMRRPIEWTGGGEGSLVSGNVFGQGTEGESRIEADAGVTFGQNLTSA